MRLAGGKVCVWILLSNLLLAKIANFYHNGAEVLGLGNADQICFMKFNAN